MGRVEVQLAGDLALGKMLCFLLASFPRWGEGWDFCGCGHSEVVIRELVSARCSGGKGKVEC